ncbi:hypothetical protein CO669_18590 [Bradyrhizobium sp. Y36]|uniref:hypothetical protein n=1 Tax=Bradyrhizobium sp. Y36 TaxID=2035447 RepID=UPI000BEA2B3C|nr:hypothetical protein [Bradyrhizobium sp. Y36]PDT88770.1 hypothetical protein CO669_18590 [Bradyrhizobium sp. Y36]
MFPRRKKLPSTLEINDSLEKPTKIPAVGDGATHGYGGDSYPATVTAVTPYRGTVVVTIHDDDHTFDRGTGQHVYTPTMRRGSSNWRLDIDFGSRGLPRAVWQRVYKTDSGMWGKSGRPGGIGFGFREYRMDPHF